MKEKNSTFALQTKLGKFLEYVRDNTTNPIPKRLVLKTPNENMSLFDKLHLGKNYSIAVLEKHGLIKSTGEYDSLGTGNNHELYIWNGTKGKFPTDIINSLILDSRTQATESRLKREVDTNINIDKSIAPLNIRKIHNTFEFNDPCYNMINPKEKTILYVLEALKWAEFNCSNSQNPDKTVRADMLFTYGEKNSEGQLVQRNAINDSNNSNFTLKFLCKSDYFECVDDRYRIKENSATQEIALYIAQRLSYVSNPVYFDKKFNWNQPQVQEVLPIEIQVENTTEVGTSAMQEYLNNQNKTVANDTLVQTMNNIQSLLEVLNQAVGNLTEIALNMQKK